MLLHMKNQFLGCKIDTSKKVLEPRLETEFWTKEAIKEIAHSTRPVGSLRVSPGLSRPNVLDIFAGSGCIGIAVLKNTNAFVDFVDISKNAIEQIKVNLLINKIANSRYKIIQSDIFSKLKGKKYDFILANPPYVALDRIKEVDSDVLRKEPKEALLAGKEGMFFIKKLLGQVKNHLNENGILFMEFDPQQKEKIKKILEKNNFKYQFKKDQFNKVRFAVVKEREET